MTRSGLTEGAPDADRQEFPRRLRRSVAIAVGGIVLSAATLVIAALVVRSTEAWTAHSRSVSRLARQVGALARDRETGVRGFLITGDRRSLQPDTEAAAPLRAAVDSLIGLTADNPSQRARAVAVQRAIERWDLQFATPIRRGVRSPAGVPGGETALAGKPLFDEIRARLDEFLREEERLYDARRSRALTSAAAFAGLVLVELTVLALLFQRSGRALAAQGAMIAEQQYALESQAMELELQSEDLQRSNAELQQANEELQSFAASVAHDLRAPLRTMNGFAGMLAADHAAALGAPGLGLLGRIREAAVHAGALIDGMLALARLRREELAWERVDLGALARQVVEDLHGLSPERRVEVAIAPDLTATGDPRLLEVVLRNLLENAWKFTRDTATPRVEVGRGGVQPARDAPYFVRDNGVGFDPEFAIQLFGMFNRLHPTEFAGTGIGLATVRRIVERHGGRVWAEGAPGKGATFYFTLPG